MNDPSQVFTEKRPRMKKLLWGLLFLCGFALVTGASIRAQVEHPGKTGYCGSHASTLYCLLPQTYSVASANAFTPLTSSFATQLTQLPLASPASGIIYIYDPATKLPVKAGQETYGPVLTERGDMIGRHKLFIAFTYQHFQFTSLDGIGLNNIPIVWNVCNTLGQCAAITSQNSISLHLNQYAFFGTFGLTSKIDVSLAIPLNEVGLGVSAFNCLNKNASAFGITDPKLANTCLGPPDPQFPHGIWGFTPPVSNGKTATGLGDLVARLKWQVFSGEKYKIAVGSDVRFPTGDSLNFLGSGAWGVRPFAAFSRGGRFSPHANLGYQWNGNSVLAGKTVGQDDKLADNFFYNAGLDAALIRRLTFAVDYLGEYVINQPRLVGTNTCAPPYYGATSCVQYPDTAGVIGSFNTSKGSFGFKFNPVKNLLISANVLLRFDHNGLRYDPVPLGGISYTF
jgi:hypothetical protein